MTLLALALAPIAFIFTYVYLRDKLEPEPLKNLIFTFLLGVLTAFPVMYLGGKAQEITGLALETSPLLYAFLVVALVEEGMKYLVLRYYNYPMREFDEPYDGIMYGVAVSLGFAAIENVFYIFLSGGNPYHTGIGRAITAVPAHAVFGIMMGFFVGKAKFMQKGNAWLERMKGLGIAILFHGAYDYFLFESEIRNIPTLGLFSMVALGTGIVLARRAIRLHAQKSEDHHSI